MCSVNDCQIYMASFGHAKFPVWILYIDFCTAPGLVFDAIQVK